MDECLCPQQCLRGLLRTPCFPRRHPSFPLPQICSTTRKSRRLRLGEGGNPKRSHRKQVTSRGWFWGVMLPPTPVQRSWFPPASRGQRSRHLGAHVAPTAGRMGPALRDRWACHLPPSVRASLRDPSPLGAAAAPQHFFRSPRSPFSAPTAPPHGSPCLPLESQASFCLSARLC